MISDDNGDETVKKRLCDISDNLYIAEKYYRQCK